MLPPSTPVNGINSVAGQDAGSGEEDLPAIDCGALVTRLNVGSAHPIEIVEWRLVVYGQLCVAGAMVNVRVLHAATNLLHPTVRRRIGVGRIPRYGPARFRIALLVIVRIRLVLCVMPVFHEQFRCC
jgi:hypothetical protein